MKIQIGKKYKDGIGKEWFVEALINGDRYIATYPCPGVGIGYGFYNEAGQKLWGDTGNIISTTNANNLVPNSTKHTGWIIVYHANDGRFARGAVSYSDNAPVYDSLEEAQGARNNRVAALDNGKADKYILVPISYET